MAPEQRVASYLVRVTFRDGRRELRLHAIGSGASYRLRSYRELAERLQAMEDDDGTASGGSPAR